MEVPLWWQDIERSNLAAMDAWDEILTRLEAELSETPDISSSVISRNLPSWSAMLQKAEEASGQLNSGMRLAEARADDAIASGMHIPVNNSLKSGMDGMIVRSRHLSDRLRRHMLVISAEISRREPRRPRGRVYRDDVPSHVDMHV